MSATKPTTESAETVALKTAAKSYKHIGTRPVRPDGVDKVTGAANYGDDQIPSGAIHGKMLRSPHAHALIKSIDCRQAQALDGVYAVITGNDFPKIEKGFALEGIILAGDFEAISRQIMARDKALFYGHPVAAVAATTPEVAQRALELIKVDYQVLPHVLTIDDALAKDAPVIEEGLQPAGSELSPNVSCYDVLAQGDIDAGFAEADLIVERTFSSPSVHYGYIEPNSCVASVDPTGKVDIWCTTQGPFAVRAYVAHIAGIEMSDIHVIPSEIGGGFGGKLFAFIEPVATLLARKAGRPVRITLDRDEVFSGTARAPAARVRVKAGATKAGKITAFEALLEFEGGAFTAGSMLEGRSNMASAYQIPNVSIAGLDVLLNKPNVLAYRAPGCPQSLLASESVLTELADGLGIDQIDFRLLNIPHEGDTTINGFPLGPVGFEECLTQAKAHPHYQSKLPAGQGRGIAFAFYHSGACTSSAAINVKDNGKMVLSLGTPDIGGSRASMVLIVAETLDIPPASINTQILGTEQIAFSDITGGSRVTFATGFAVEKAAQQVKRELCQRAANEWGVDVEQVEWREGAAHYNDQVLRLAEITRDAYKTGGAISVSLSTDTGFQGPSCNATIVDAALDKETGKVTVERVTAVQDVGTAIHPDYVEGQMQGGVAQALGWALNEEYYWDENGKILNPSFLDYRIPVASDLPMIDTKIVEVPEPNHPYGVRGAGETPICAPMAAIAIAVNSLLETPITEVPLTPSRVMAALVDE